jgi:YesN/AraC family two-component response regulator
MKPHDREESPGAILVAEDDRKSQAVLSSILRAKFPGVQLFLAENGRTGLVLFKKHAPSVVITDISMPIMNGIQMAQEIKKLRPDTVTIALTAHTDAKLVSEATACGIDHLVRKPVRYAELQQLLNEAFQGSGGQPQERQ